MRFLNIFISLDRTVYLTGVSVYHSRIQAGRFLAMDSPVDADLVVGVPNREMQQRLDMLWSQAFLTELPL